MVKTLLVFAHFGEASCFIEKLEALELKDFKNFFLAKNEEISLVIVGEEKLSIIMTLCKVFFTHPNIQEVYNFGICAALTDDFKKNGGEGNVLSIRTLYEYEMEPSFKSYTTDNEGATLDLISYFKRVQDEDLAKKLSYFAPTLDREAHTIASVVRKYPFKFYVYKIVSDFADGKKAERKILESAAEYSKKLYEFFHEKFLMAKNGSNDILTKINSKKYLDSIYATEQQRKLLGEYDELLWKNKGFSLDEFFVTKDVQEKLKEGLMPKHKTKILIDLLEKTLNPLEHRFNEKMNFLVKSLKKEGVDFEVNVMNLRKSKFSFYFESEKDLLKKLKTIELFDVKALENLVRGHIDV